ncbi:MAG: DUF3558 domain-containing protein [Actinophytocola sp.]|uniref:DUF3558 domain-containing protein n=1 Tax=Actinophytocola sp. TaxID=1872138 RepID=UPI003D6B00EA
MRARALLVVVIGAALVTGCTATSSGEPAPETPTETESSASPSSVEQPDDLPSDGAPKVANPLDASQFEQDPCRALTQAQATELNIVHPGEPYEGSFGNACEWQGPDRDGGRVAIDFLSDDRRGMSSVYRSSDRGEFAFFEPLDSVAGHPLAAFGIADSRESEGYCAVAVGITDELVVTVFLNLSRVNVRHKDPCEIGAQVAEMTLTTMGAS